MPPKLSAVAAAMIAGDSDPAHAASPLQAAGRAAKKRSRLEIARLTNTPGVDSQDVGLLVEEEFAYTAAAFAPNAAAGAPLWARQLLRTIDANHAATTANHVATTATINANHAATTAALTAIRSQLANLNARVSNGLASLNDTLTPLTNNAGAIPNGFPVLKHDVGSLTGPELTALLGAYGLNVPQGVEDRRRAFAVFIGVRLQ